MGCLEGEKGLGIIVYWLVMFTIFLILFCFYLNIFRDSKFIVLVGWIVLVVRNCFFVLIERGREMRFCFIIYVYCFLFCFLKKYLRVFCLIRIFFNMRGGIYVYLCFFFFRRNILFLVIFGEREFLDFFVFGYFFVNKL